MDSDVHLWIFSCRQTTNIHPKRRISMMYCVCYCSSVPKVFFTKYSGYFWIKPADVFRSDIGGKPKNCYIDNVHVLCPCPAWLNSWTVHGPESFPQHVLTWNLIYLYYSVLCLVSSFFLILLMFCFVFYLNSPCLFVYHCNSVTTLL